MIVWFVHETVPQGGLKWSGSMLVKMLMVCDETAVQDHHSAA